MLLNQNVNSTWLAPRASAGALVPYSLRCSLWALPSKAPAGGVVSFATVRDQDGLQLRCRSGGAWAVGPGMRGGFAGGGGVAAAARVTPGPLGGNIGLEVKDTAK